MVKTLLEAVMSLVGAAIGAAVGVFLFVWLKHRGYYGLVIPGAMLGLGCNLLSRRRSIVRGAVAGVAASLVGLLSEWKFFPRNNDSLEYFVTHPATVENVTWIMVGFGTLFAFWWGKDASPWIGDRSSARKPRNIEV